MFDKAWLSNFQPDRRDALRLRSRRKAFVVANSGWLAFNAEVLNLSADGALIQFEGSAAFPESSELRFDNQKKQVTRVWTRGPMAGVIFDA